MVFCSVNGCSSKTAIGVSLHSFPKDHDRLQKWISFCNNKPLWKPKTGNRLCSVHFDNESWEPRTDIKRLKFDASPSIKSSSKSFVFDLKELDSKEATSKGAMYPFPESQKVLFERPASSNLSFPAEATIATFSKIQNMNSMLNISKDTNIPGI